MTEFEPLILPTAESACSEFLAAVLEANVSGSDVPKATNVIAVTGCLIPRTHPNKFANSPTTAVTIPMKMSETPNAHIPPQYRLGGIMAKNTFQPIEKKCKIVSYQSG